MKTFINNVVLLDMITATPESVEGLKINNAVMVIVTPTTKPLLSKISINNIVNIAEIPDGTTLSIQNGNLLIDGDFEIGDEKNIFWVRNGNILIKEGVTAAALEHIFSHGGIINGNIYLPKALSAVVPALGLSINGNIHPYLVGSLLYSENLQINDAFLQGLPENSEITAFENVSISSDTSPEIFGKHIKGLTIFGNTVLPQKLQGAFYKIARQYNEIIEIPEGYTFYNKSQSVSPASLLTFKGKSIYTHKNIYFKDGINTDLLRQLDFRFITKGTVILPADIATAVLDKVQANHIYTYQGKLVTVQNDLLFTKSDKPVSYLITHEGSLTIPDTTNPSDIQESIHEIFLYGSISLQKELMQAISDKIVVYDGALFSPEEDEEESDDAGQYDTVINNAVNFKL